MPKLLLSPEQKKPADVKTDHNFPKFGTKVCTVRTQFSKAEATDAVPR